MNTCDICNEGMIDGWTTDCGSLYICSKKCMEKRLVNKAEIPQKRAKQILELYYADDIEEDNIIDEEWEWISGLFWTEWYDDEE